MYKKKLKYILALCIALVFLALVVLTYPTKREITRECSDDLGACIVIKEKDLVIGKILGIGSFNNYELKIENLFSSDYYKIMTLPKDCRDAYLFFQCGVHEVGNEEDVSISIYEDEERYSGTIYEVTWIVPLGQRQSYEFKIRGQLKANFNL